MWDNGSASHHQNQHKIKTYWAVCSDSLSCPGPPPHGGHSQPWPAGGYGRKVGAAQPQRLWGTWVAWETQHRCPFPSILSGFSSHALPPLHHQAYLSGQQLLKDLHLASCLFSCGTSPKACCKGHFSPPAPIFCRYTETQGLPSLSSPSLIFLALVLRAWSWWTIH